PKTPLVRIIRYPERGPRQLLQLRRPLRRLQERLALLLDPAELAELPEDDDPADQRERRRHQHDRLDRRAPAEHHLHDSEPPARLLHRQYHYLPAPSP